MQKKTAGQKQGRSLQVDSAKFQPQGIMLELVGEACRQIDKVIGMFLFSAQCLVAKIAINELLCFDSVLHWQYPRPESIDTFLDALNKEIIKLASQKYHISYNTLFTFAFGCHSAAMRQILMFKPCSFKRRGRTNLALSDADLVEGGSTGKDLMSRKSHQLNQGALGQN